MGSKTSVSCHWYINTAKIILWLPLQQFLRTTSSAHFLTRSSIFGSNEMVSSERTLHRREVLRPVLPNCTVGDQHQSPPISADARLTTGTGFCVGIYSSPQLSTCFLRFACTLFTMEIDAVQSLFLEKYQADRCLSVCTVLIFFLVLCLGECAGEFYVCFVSSATAARTAFLPPAGIPWPGCLTVGLPVRLTLASWIPNIFVNSIFFLASLVRFRHSFRENSLSRKEMGQQSALLRICIRDGTLFYFLTISIVIINMSTTIIKNGQMALLTSPWLITIYSFSGAHIILNLRSAGKPANLTDVSQTMKFEVRSQRHAFPQNTTIGTNSETLGRTLHEEY
ncbi:hypothetical protein M413DRAFT_293799 [Hebeloma cylindrosporum]|uniref:G protein-coupled receptor n=1 Tax=Hebeloma cylindrosporum TaxID=76867 RepID=A0A0C2Y7H8_HEBCY|nr:hypothetical protein M413DRAFT_293799 [Hebeloma cylindrosporum h7]